MQAKQQPRTPVGVIFDASFEQIDHVLALALLYGLQGTRDIRVASLSVSRPDLKAASFVDAVARFLMGSNPRGALPVGVPPPGAAGRPVPMMDAVVGKFPHTIRKPNDTADEAAVIRNGISAQQPGNCVVVVAGPPSNVLRSLELGGMPDLVKQRVKTLVCTDPDAKLLAAWPTPVVAVPAGLLRFPASGLEKFSWAPSHPVAEAYRAFQAMPYDAPMAAAAGALYAARPEQFTLADSGKYKTLGVAPERQEEVIEMMVSLISAQPPQAQGRGRGGQ